MNASQINVASDRFCSLEQDAVDMTLEDQEDACRYARREKHNFSREQRKLIQVMNVKRKRDFLCLENVNGEMVNILEGLELHTDVFNAVEQQKIVDKVCELQEKARKGELKRGFTPKGKGRSAIQFGCCFNYRTSKAGTPAGILRHETVEPLPALFKVIIRRLVEWHVLPPTCVPDCCVVNIYDEGDCIPPHVDNHDFLRPFCTVSFLSECNILFGSNLKLEENGEYSGGSYSLPLPVGSVLVLNGNGANVAKHCVPEVPTKRISITFRKMNESKRPIWFTPEPDLQWIQPLQVELESSSSSDHTQKKPVKINKTGTTRVCMHAPLNLKHVSICFTLYVLSPFQSRYLIHLAFYLVMASDIQHRPVYGSTTVPRSTNINNPVASFLRQLQSKARNHSGQLFGLLAFFISGGILLLLTGITVTAFVLGFIAFLPIIIISSPIWIPLFLLVTGFLSLAGMVFGTAALISWTYRYFKGMHPVGSDQVDYARSRIFDTAAHVKDYAGGYFHGKQKDAAPGA
ncbi:hypothetical protein YC2023_075361 [Brassica napus]